MPCLIQWIYSCHQHELRDSKVLAFCTLQDCASVERPPCLLPAMICLACKLPDHPCRKAASVNTLFGKMSGTASGGTIESILNQLGSEPWKEQKAAAHPYSLNPPSSRCPNTSTVINNIKEPLTLQGLTQPVKQI